MLHKVCSVQPHSDGECEGLGQLLNVGMVRSRASLTSISLPRFMTLSKFLGDLSTVFISTAALESDFSTLQWERNVDRTSTLGLSLDEILHFKQNETLLRVKH